MLLVAGHYAGFGYRDPPLSGTPPGLWVAHGQYEAAVGKTRVRMPVHGPHIPWTILERLVVFCQIQHGVVGLVLIEMFNLPPDRPIIGLRRRYRHQVQCLETMIEGGCAGLVHTDTKNAMRERAVCRHPRVPLIRSAWCSEVISSIQVSAIRPPGIFYLTEADIC